ncbi:MULTISPECIES: NAD-dependent epimerase/dehydratase family protein [unclassified Microbacterium]|nr:MULTISPECIES: NAD-dependent epimerase/dehydratase family protein [unclassified Microbacterium]
MITGALGFLGSSLSQALLDQGHAVIGVDDRSSESPDAVRVEERAGFRLLVHDIADRDRIDVMLDAIDGAEVHQIFHLACPASPIDYLRAPTKTLATCADGTRAVIEVAQRASATLVFTSTSEVYGDPLQTPQPETYFGNVNPVGPRAVYDEGKRFAEAMITAFGRAAGLDYRIARIFNSYGPGMRLGDGRLLPSAISALTRGEPVPVYGDGSQTRSMCYVDDTVSGLLALARSTASGPVNIGNDDERTVMDLLIATAQAMGCELRVDHRPARQDDPARRRPDTALARSILGWSARVPFEVGIERTVAQMRHRAPESDASRSPASDS